MTGLRLRNRLVMAPMVTGMARGGRVTGAMVDHYAARARAGVGLVVVEASAVCWDHRVLDTNLAVDTDDALPGLSRLAAAVKAGGAAVLLQLLHAGPKTLDGVRVGPGNMRVLRGPPPRALGVDQIAAVPGVFAQAAVRARRAGFDGVELHAAHFYLLGAFCSPHANHRADTYGGSAAGRRRLLLETVAAVRQAAGHDAILGVRIDGVQRVPGGSGPAEAAKLAKALERAGVDLIHVSGVAAPPPHSPIPHQAHEATPERPVPPLPSLPGIPEGSYLPCAGAVRSAVRVPVIGVGRVTGARAANLALDLGLCDLVAMGRGLIADPALAARMLAGEACPHPCAHCGGCLRRVMSRQPIACDRNLHAPRPGEIGPKPGP